MDHFLRQQIVHSSVHAALSCRALLGALSLRQALCRASRLKVNQPSQSRGGGGGGYSGAGAAAALSLSSASHPEKRRRPLRILGLVVLPVADAATSPVGVAGVKTFSDFLTSGEETMLGCYREMGWAV